MKNLQPSDPSSMGGYPLLSRLGVGGMGQVFLSRTPSGRLLALKTVRDDLSSDPGFEERFAREIRNSDRVRSPWTVTVVDFSPPGQRPQWLATEYVPAPALDEWVERQGPLPEGALLSLAAELCGALQAVHQAHLTHRDVKPGNVLLARDRPRLIDFGIARAADDPRHTRVGGVLGSPGYLAPDQATGGVSAEPADVFSLAAVLVYAATGHGPFSRPKEDVPAAALVYRAVHEAPDLDGVPSALVPVLTSCLAKDPAERPTAAELGARLDEIGARIGQWPDVCPPPLVAELAAQEWPTRTLVDVTPRPTVAAGPEDPSAGTTQDSTVPGAPPARRGRRSWLLITAPAVAVAAAAAVAVYLGFADDSSGSGKTGKAESSHSAVAAKPVRKVVRAPYKLVADRSVQTRKSKLIMQRDGNLVIYDENGRARWAAGTLGDGNYAHFQDDGNLVVYNKTGKAVWAAGTFGHPGATLVLQADGNLVIKSDATVLWETKTAH